MSAKNENAMTIKKTWELSKRGYGIINKLFPGFLTLSAVHAVLSAAQPLVALYFSARIIDALASGLDVSVIVLNAVLVVAISFVLAIARAIINRKLSVSRSRNTIKQYCYYADRYIDFDFEHVEKPALNELIANVEAGHNGNGLGLNRLMYGFESIVRNAVGIIAAGALLVGMFTVSSAFSASFITSGWAMLALCAIVILMQFANWLVHKAEEAALKRMYSDNPKANTIMFYYFQYLDPSSAAKDIRLYNQGPAIRAIMNEYTKPGAWSFFYSAYSKSSGLTAAFNAVAGGCVYLFIGLRALAGMYTIGSVVKYVGAITNLVSNITQLVSGVAMFFTNAQYLEQLYKYLDNPDVKYLGTLTTEKRADSEYELEFHNVSFRYPGTDKYALRNFSLKLKIGQKLAVVGMNGSGKTTMIKLLTRLYDPTEGRITLNGFDISKYDYDEYMALFSVVFQDFSLFSLPLGQNVAASVEVDEQRAKECLERAGFGERLSTMPKGLETCLHKDFDKDGIEVSGGEAQKIALARALYKNAPVVVLDEPTAALDPIAEFEVYSRFDEIVGEKTAIFISHRLSSCRFCNDIAVFHEGELIQRGSHDELVANTSGKYHELWHAQAQYYTNE